MKKSELIKVAKELNKVLGLEPQIDVELSKQDLFAKIKYAATLLDPLDEFSKSTLEFLKNNTSIPEDMKINKKL